MRQGTFDVESVDVVEDNFPLDLDSVTRHDETLNVDSVEVVEDMKVIALDSDPKKKRQSTRQITRDGPSLAGFASVGKALRSRYLVTNTLFNVFGSAAGPLLVMWIIFGVIGSGPYEWNGATVLGIIFASPFVSATLCNILVPMAAVQMVHKGWFFKIRRGDETVSRLARFLPFLALNSLWRIGLARYFAIGMIASIFYWPFALIIARFAVGPTLSTWTHIGFSVCYCVALAPSVSILGMLSFAFEPNFDRIQRGTKTHTSCCKNFWCRFLLCIRLLW